MINQEFFKEHENLKHRKVYRHASLATPLDVSFEYSL